MPSTIPEMVYTDRAFSANQEKRVRKVLKLVLWVIGLAGAGWVAGYAIFLGINAPMVVNVLMVVLSFTLLWNERKIALRPLVHSVFWFGFIFIWFLQLAAEGLPAPHHATVHLWFLVVVIGAFLLLIRENRFIVGGYTVLLFASFVICEFGLIHTTSIFPTDPQGEALKRAITLITIFETIILLTQAWAREVRDAEEQLAQANNRLENLLENMLPRSISERLRREGKTFADGIAECSVLFVDIVGFTKLSSGMPPEELVRLLDDIFSKFDELTVTAGLEKIKTIGDSYMVAAGLPVARADHAQALVRLAMAMRGVIREYGLHIRSGINSGNVVAGVIGKKKFIYDLWGDTVNVASRMESQGVIDEIQVTQATASLIEAEFELRPLGEIAIKGKGNMPVFLVTAERVVSKAQTTTV